MIPERNLKYTEATDLQSLKHLKKERNRILVWLAKINNILPYELHLSDTEIEILAKILGELVEKELQPFEIKIE